MNQELFSEISAELDRAESARTGGNEGLARVCARRAAGLAAREYLCRHTAKYSKQSRDDSESKSAYEILKTLAAFPGLAPHLKLAAVHLTLRINEEFQLPPGIDLIADARKLIGGLK